VFRAIIWAIGGNYMRATKISSFFGRSIGYLLIAVGVFFIVWKRDVSSGLWIAFIGWFLENAAAQSYRQLKHSPLRQNYSDDDPGVSDER
ncbi:hypothetical protein M1O29_01610, partial [Dehalococcoidia bacterium]|nr:hypothetical protein [Dehalococcoidia bacterium]